MVGGNIGKNKITPNERAVEDYLTCVDALHAHVDYFVVNVSSPNTPGLRELQGREPLTLLLRAVVKRNADHPGERPVFLKIAPGPISLYFTTNSGVRKGQKMHPKVAKTIVKRKFC